MALSAVRVKPGARQGSSLNDELKVPDADRALCPAARPTASRSRALATSGEVRSPNAKSTVTEAASSDEPIGPFSEAASVTALRLFTEWDIQAAAPAWLEARCPHRAWPTRASALHLQANRENNSLLPFSEMPRSSGDLYFAYCILKMRSRNFYLSHPIPFKGTKSVE